MVGCVLSSALACVLAKATGEPIIIQKETQIDQTTQLVYQILAPSQAPAQKLETDVLVTAQRIPTTKASFDASPSTASSRLNFKSIRNHVFLLLVSITVASLFIWFPGWQLYHNLSIWQALPNYDYQNILVFAIAVAFTLLLSAGGLMDTLLGDLRFQTAKQLGIIFGLDVIIWAVCWLTYGRLLLGDVINNYVYGIGTITTAAVISAAILLLKPEILQNLRKIIHRA